jgi:hypothetical protein
LLLGLYFGILGSLLGSGLFTLGGGFAFEYWEVAFTLGFWCGKLLEGKRIVEGKMLKRG